MGALFLLHETCILSARNLPLYFIVEGLFLLENYMRREDLIAMWIETNNNPAGRNVGDCAVRAISIALDMDWEDAFWILANAAFNMADMPSSNGVWGAVLRQNGFYRKAIPDTCPDCYTAADFARDNPRGIYVLGFGNHVSTIIDGNIFDSWDSSNEIPQYYWYKKG